MMLWYGYDQIYFQVGTMFQSKEALIPNNQPNKVSRYLQSTETFIWSYSDEDATQLNVIIAKLCFSTMSWKILQYGWKQIKLWLVI